MSGSSVSSVCNLTTAAFLCQPELLNYFNKNLIPQMAFDLAEEGLRVMFILKDPYQNNLDMFNEVRFSDKPEVLERIKYRSFLSGSELLKWCHIESHQTYRRRPPTALFVQSIDNFFNGRNTLRLCAALLDVVSYFSLLCSKSSMYFTVTLKDTLPGVNRMCNVFFNKVWEMKRSQEYLVVKECCKINCDEEKKEITLRVFPNDFNTVKGHHCSFSPNTLGTLLGKSA